MRSLASGLNRTETQEVTANGERLYNLRWNGRRGSMVQPRRRQPLAAQQDEAAVLCRARRNTSSHARRFTPQSSSPSRWLRSGTLSKRRQWRDLAVDRLADGRQTDLVGDLSSRRPGHDARGHQGARGLSHERSRRELASIGGADGRAMPGWRAKSYQYPDRSA